MTLFVVGAGLALLALPAVTRGLGARVLPSVSATATAFALVAGAVLVIGSALIMAAQVVLACCTGALGPIFGNPAVSVIAAATALTSIVLGSRAFLRARRSLRHVRAAMVTGEPSGFVSGCDVVVIPDERSYAVGVPSGWRGGSVLVSRGLVDSLSPSELDAVFAHEAAHLRLRHRWLLVLAIIVEGALWFYPITRLSTDVLRLTVERWADEVAVKEPRVSRVALRTALMLAAGIGSMSSIPAFGAADGLIQRLEALDDRWADGPRLKACLALGAPIVLAFAIALVASNGLAHVVSCVVSDL